MTERKLGFIGAGLMAEALLDGILKAGVAPKECIFASDPSPDRRAVFAGKLGRELFVSNVDVVEAADVILFCVKPQVLPAAAEEVAPSVGADHLVVSIAPGITLAALGQMLGAGRVVRVMPNTPALVGEGAAAFCCSSGATDEDRQVVEGILSAVGLCFQVDEKLMDAVTGLSGSGPAYVFLAIEALSDGGVKAGLPRTVATHLAAQTVLGAARMVLETGRHPGDLKDQVATPGGTTIEGIHALEKAGLRRALMDAVTAAARRSAELGRTH